MNRIEELVKFRQQVNAELRSKNVSELEASTIIIGCRLTEISDTLALIYDEMYEGKGEDSSYVDKNTEQAENN